MSILQRQFFVIFYQPELINMLKRFQACMLLAVVGDAIGYKRGQWEFNYNGLDIHKQMMQLTNHRGVLHLVLSPRFFPYSDDTVMHFATARGLLQSNLEDELGKICKAVAKEYKACWKDMPDRAPGVTCQRTVRKLLQDGSNWQVINYEPKGGGCGASMRAACIGLYYTNNIKKLVEVSIQTGRITNHNPLGYLGAVTSAYFTALAIKNCPPHQWLHHLFREALPLARQHIKNNREGQVNLKSGDWQKFQECWKKYAATRKMSIQSPTHPVFPQQFGIFERQKYYHSLSLSGWPGALGVDSAIIAYDALLGSQDNWEQLCLRSMLHGGDSDSTGTIAGAWFGAAYGFNYIPSKHLDFLQGRDEALNLGSQLYQKVQHLF